jgi:hypothetical protein
MASGKRQEVRMLIAVNSGKIKSSFVRFKQ